MNLIKNYKQEVFYFLDKIQNDEKFSLCRYGDGEWAAITNTPLLCGNNPAKGITEWTTTGNNENYNIARKLLSESIQYKHPNYYVGICPCYTDMMKFSEQPEENVTYANIFVNDNYSTFVDDYFPVFKKKSIHLVANSESQIKNLPFKVEKFYPVDYNAWVNNLNLIDEIQSQNLEDKLFLFCSGPFSNILCYKLWESNQNNTYLDIGSTLDPWIQTGNPRGYYLGVECYSKSICPCPKFN